MPSRRPQYVPARPLGFDHEAAGHEGAPYLTGTRLQLYVVFLDSAVSTRCVCHVPSYKRTVTSSGIKIRKLILKSQRDEYLFNR